MTTLLRILFAIVLLVSSSLSLAAMAAEHVLVQEAHTQHQHDEPEQVHDGLGCGMAVCCFMFAADEPVEPADCSPASPQAVVSVPDLPDSPDPHEHPPQG